MCSTESQSNEDSAAPTVEQLNNKLVEAAEAIKQKDEQIEQLQTEVSIQQNLRRETLQDMAHARTRNRQEVENAKAFGCTAFAKDLFEVSDVLDKAVTLIPSESLKQASSSTDAHAQELVKIHQGMKMIKSMLNRSFSKNGISRIEPELGSPFDPHLHSAKFEIPQTDGGHPPKTVGEIFRVGFSLNGRVIRPAEIGVIKYD